MLRVGNWPLQVDGETRSPGEPIPEARDWSNLRAYIDTDRVVDDARSDDAHLLVGIRSLQVDGETRRPGEPIPEARTWPNLRAYLETGRVVFADTDPASESGAMADSPFPDHRSAPPQKRRTR